MPTTILDGELLHEAYARRFREEGAQIEREIKMEEMNKAVDTAFDANDRAMLILRDMQNEITKARLMIADIETANEEFRFARMFGVANGTIDSVLVSAEMAIEKMLEADSALRYLKGGNDD